MAATDSTTTSERPNWRLLVAVLVVAALFHGVVLFAFPGGLNLDTDGYRKLAENLRNHGVFGSQARDGAENVVQPTAFRPPLYPLLLSLVVRGGVVSPLAVGMMHFGLSVATVALVLVISNAWKLGRWSPLAALFVACDPILLYQSAQIMTETLATFLAVLTLAAFTWFDRRPKPGVAGVLGILFGAAVLCRPTFLPWLVLCVPFVLRRPTGWSRRLLSACALLVGVGIVVAPWGVRNYRQFGQWRITTTHGGYTLLLGNNPSFYRFLREASWGRTWNSDELAEAWAQRWLVRDPNDGFWHDLKGGSRAEQPADTNAPYSEIDDDRLAYALAARYIREEPEMFAYSCVVRVGRLWGLVPKRVDAHESTKRRLLRYASGAWYLAVFLLAALGVCSLRTQILRSPWLWGLLLCLAFTAVHSLYWSNLRMRAPLMPWVCLLATAGFARLAASRGGSK